MTGSRLWIKNFQKIIAIALMIAWIFIGVPRIWNFPPKIQEAQAAIALRGTTKIGSAGNGGDVTLTFDTGGNAPQTGDVVILFGGRGNTSDTQAWGPITSGYTAIATIDSTGPKFGVWYKVMGATADTTVTGEGGGSGAHGVAYGAYVIDGSTIDSAIFDQTAVSTGQVTQVPNGPAIVTQTDGALVVTHAAGGTNDMSRGTVSGYTLIPGASVNETNDFASEAAYTTVATAGTEDPPAWSNWTSSLGGAITIAFKPKQTTTLATGTDPSTATVAPESGIRDAGSFTFQTSAGSDSITALTVILAASGTPYNGLSEVRITNNAGTTTYFSATSSPSSNTLNFSGGTPIPASTSSTQFKIRVTPKTHALISSPPGAEYNLSPYVSAWTGTNTKVGSDSNANTLTIDNLSPNNATSTSGSAGAAQVTLNWTTSSSSDFNRSVVLRWAASTPGSEVPAEGTEYGVDNAIGAATVACARSDGASTAVSGVDGAGTGGCSAVALTNGQDYSYKVFQKDSRFNYDVGVTFTGSPFRPAAVTTTLGTGTDATTATVAPESGIRDAGSFTFQTSAGSDSITALTVILAASGTPYNGLSEVRVTNNAGTTTYFSAISNPLSNTLNFSGGTPIPASASSTQFKIRVTPKTHALISSPPGAEYNLSPYVSAWTGTNTKVGSDSNANTLTIDNLSPNNATSTSGSAGAAQVTLNWTTSNSGDFDTTSGSVILRWASGSAGSEVPAEGTDYSAGNTITTATVACAISSAGSTSQSKIDGSGGSAGCTTSALTNDQQYTYKVFQKDTRGNYDVGVLIGTFSPSAAPNPVPTTTSISPTSKNAGESEFTLTVNGTNFISGSVVKFDGSNRTTTYVSSTQLTATVPASDLTTGGIFSITVFNLSPGGGTSNAQTFTVNNLVPTTTSISPTTKTVYDSGFTLTVNGTNFVSTSVVKFDGSNRTTTYVSSTQLTATIPASDLTAAGTFLITVFNPTPGGGTSDAQTLTVNNPVPTTTSIDPTGKTVGDSEFTMTVSGTLFISSSVVRFNGSDRTTTFVNSTTLTAAIPASDIASEGTFPITVFNPTPGGGESNSQTFTISVTPPTPNPVPTLTSISPSSATQNDSEFTMTLTGTDFVSTSVARFNGVSRTTTYVSSTQLTATIPSSDLTTAGNFPITVFTPSPGGGESGSKTFTVTPAPTAPTVPLPPVGEAVRPTTIIFSGKAFPGGKMFMVDKDIRYEKTVSQDTITNDDGTFYTSFIGILQGPHSFSLIIKDKEGRGSQTKFFNINTLVQDFVVKDLIIAPTVALVAYSVTRGTATVVKGYTTPQSGVVAEIDGIIKKEAQAGQDGAYKLTIDTGPLEFGSHQMRLKQTLVGGKGESDYSPLKNFIVSRVLLPKADFNDDGAVDIRDWSIFLFHWGSKDMEKRMKIDLNNDGKIDISDFSIFVRNIRKK